jgi:hypothetical protein
MTNAIVITDDYGPHYPNPLRFVYESIEDAIDANCTDVHHDAEYATIYATTRYENVSVVVEYEIGDLGCEAYIDVRCFDSKARMFRDYSIRIAPCSFEGGVPSYPDDIIADFFGRIMDPFHTTTTTETAMPTIETTETPARATAEEVQAMYARLETAVAGIRLPRDMEWVVRAIPGEISIRVEATGRRYRDYDYGYVIGASRVWSLDRLAEHAFADLVDEARSWMFDREFDADLEADAAADNA